MTTRAMRLGRPGPIGGRPLDAVELEAASPRPDEVAIAVSACGVCRTDLQLVEGDLAARRLPVVPGHQVVGRVVAAGAEVTGWTVGDRVGVGWFGGSCGACDRCREGLQNLCPQAVFTGWDRDGGYAETMVARADAVVALPPGFADLDAAPLLCGGTIGYRSLRISGIRPGGRLGLYGFGASALIVIQIARHWGCEVFVATRSPTEQARARELGASWTGGPHDRPPVELDAAITFAPVGSVVVAALSAVRPGGTVAVNAIHLDGIPAFDYGLLWGERSLRSVANSTRQDAEELLRLAATIPIRTVHDVYPLASANEALADLAGGRVGGAAVLQIG